MSTPKKKYFYGVCQDCKGPTKYRESTYCRRCFWHPERRFWSNVEKTDKCWNWTGKTRHKFGYGICRFQKRSMGTHRASWILCNGPIPDGKSVLHNCDNPLCVNPKHLRLGTQFDNMQDRKKRGRHPHGESQHNHKLMEKDVLEIRKIYKRNSLEFGQNALAKIFGVDQAAIWSILHRKTWAHI